MYITRETFGVIEFEGIVELDTSFVSSCLGVNYMYQVHSANSDMKIEVLYGKPRGNYNRFLQFPFEPETSRYLLLCCSNDVLEAE